MKAKEAEFLPVHRVMWSGQAGAHCVMGQEHAEASLANMGSDHVCLIKTDEWTRYHVFFSLLSHSKGGMLIPVDLRGLNGQLQKSG